MEITQEDRNSLVSRNYEQLFYVSMNVFPQMSDLDREDLVHDSILRFLRTGNFDNTVDAKFRAYMKKVIKTTYLHNIKRKREKIFNNIKDHESTVKDEFREGLDRLVSKYNYSVNGESVDSELIANHLKEKVNNNYLVPLLLSVDGYKDREIAEKLNITTKEAGYRKSYARRDGQKVLLNY